MGLDRKGWLKAAGYTLWGLLLWVAVGIGLPVVLFDTIHEPLLSEPTRHQSIRWIWDCSNGLYEMGVPEPRCFWLAFLLWFLPFQALGLSWTALSILRRGPPGGRLGTARVVLLAFAVPILWWLLVSACASGSVVWPDGVQGVLERLVRLAGITLSIAWCLTWAIDVVRRQRPAGAA